VRDIVAMRDLHGHTPEQIAEVDYPHLTLGQVYAALAYYEDHRDEIDEYARCEAQFVQEFKQINADLIAADLSNDAEQ
jgi:hypothetical protein